jgi:hypothetical protein
MQRVRFRRLVPVAALAVLGLVALAGCQSTPGTAVALGDQRVTDAQIDDEARAASADFLAANYSAEQYPQLQDPAYMRLMFANLHAFNLLAEQYASDHGIVVPPRDYKTMAANYHLSVDNPFVRLTADHDAYAQALASKIKPATPTEQDLKDVYQKLVAAGFTDAYASLRPQILQLPQLGSSVAVRNELRATADRHGLEVSPRYLPLEINLGEVQLQSGTTLAIVTLPLGDQNGQPAVRESS